MTRKKSANESDRIARVQAGRRRPDDWLIGNMSAISPQGGSSSSDGWHCLNAW